MNIPIKIVVGDNLDVLDMFADEGISIKSVVKDMNDPKKLFTDFSRSFTLPASKQNNRVFKHYYNIDIQNSVDSRELIPAKILMNNSVYKVGNVRIDGARVRGGLAIHYKVTFIGKLSELSRQIGTDKLNDLDFVGLYDDSFDFISEIQNTTKRDLMFPLASRKERFLADSGTRSLGIEGARNIAYSGSTAAEDYGIREQDIVGALSVGAILDKIENKYAFNFTGILQADYIRDLYLWLHQIDKERTGEKLTAIATGFTWSSASGLTNSNFVPLTNGFVFIPTEETALLGRDRMFMIAVNGTFSGAATIKLKVGGNVVREVSTSGSYTDYFKVFGDYSPRIFQVEVDTQVSNSVSVGVRIDTYDKEYVNSYWKAYLFKNTTSMTASAVTGTTGTYSVQNNLPDMSVMEFLSSIFKMFNIVAEVDDNLNISTKHYDHFMSEGEVRDFTEYVDVSGYDVNRPNLYSSLLMGFEEPKLALEQGYKAVNGRNYGEIKYDLIGSTGAKLSGSTYKLDIKNQRTPLEPIDDLDDNSDFRVCYALFSDTGGTEQSIKPMFTYICRPDTTTGSVSQIALYGNLTASSSSVYTMPSNVHQRFQATPVGVYGDVGLYFGEELSEYRYGFTMNGNGLWNSFYRGTTALMFDEDKRKVKLKAHIPQSKLLLLKLSDTLRISNKFYNINAIETNYLSGVTELDLILVGNSKLEQFATDTRSLENESTTELVYITYVDASTGEISNTTIAPSSTINLDMVGSVIGSSGDVIETFA